MAKKNKVLLIGWDAADWKIIDKLMDAGLMPAMKRVVENGVRGRLATLDPPLSPMLWTSMATGVRPYKHGVLGFVEHDGHGGVRPISSHGRKVKAFWNMMTMEGKKTNVIGWWPSNPVESINGVMVSNNFQQEKISGEVIELEDWTIPPGTIYPESMIDQLADLRVHPHEISGNLVMPFVPNALELSKKEDKRLTVITRFLAHATSIHAATTELIENTEWDLTACYHDAIDHFCHAFMKYHPPKMDGLDEDAYMLFKDVVNGAYVYHDMMLDRLLNLVDDDTTVMIVSDHGFHSDHLRPRFVPQVPSGPAVEHAPYGIFVAMGPGIKKGERIHGARILDVTPTLLAMFDMPIGRDMDGKPLMDIFDHPKEVKYIDSWENDTRFGGELVLVDEPDEATNEAALQQLIDLGYIDDFKLPEGADAEQAKKEKLKETLRENNFYLAKSYANGGQYDDALELLLEIENRDNPDFRYLIEIVDCSVKTKRFALAEEYIRYIRKNKLMTERYLDVLEAQVQVGLGNPGKGLFLLEKAVEEFPDSPQVLLDMGKLLTGLWQNEKALLVFKEVLRLDPDNPYAYHGAGLALLRMERYDEALDYFLKAVEHLFHYPLAHLHIGETLALLKEYEMAKRSFEIVEAIAPQYIKSYRWLQDLHEITGDHNKAIEYKNKIAEFDLGEKVIITGLPGEKLFCVIKQLENSGATVQGSEDDPFAEYINVTNPNWLDEINTDVIYVPINLIASLPMRFSYRILYVNDDKEQVMNFLNKLDNIKSGTYNSETLEGIERQENNSRIWLNHQPNVDILYLNNIAEVENELISSYFSNKQ